MTADDFEIILGLIVFVFGIFAFVAQMRLFRIAKLLKQLVRVQYAAYPEATRNLCPWCAGPQVELRSGKLYCVECNSPTAEQREILLKQRADSPAKF